MANIERSMNDTHNTELSFDQYKILVNKFKVREFKSTESDKKFLIYPNCAWY